MHTCYCSIGETAYPTFDDVPTPRASVVVLPGQWEPSRDTSGLGLGFWRNATLQNTRTGTLFTAHVFHNGRRFMYHENSVSIIIPVRGE